jgi:hypothetical protein
MIKGPWPWQSTTATLCKHNVVVCLQRKRGRAVGRKTVVPSLCLCAFRCLPEYGMHENRSGSAALFSLVSEAFKSRFCFCFEEGKKKSEIRNRWPHLQRSQCCWIWSLPSPFLISFVVPSVLLPVPPGFFHSRRCRARWVRTRTWLDFREKLLPARGLFV